MKYDDKTNGVCSAFLITIIT